MKIKDYVGDVFQHYALGLVKVMSVVEKSRTMVNIIVIQKAKGWCKDEKRYKPVMTIKEYSNGSKSLHWKTYTDSHTQFGHIDKCHIKDLIPFKG